MARPQILSPSELAAFEADGYVFKRPPMSDQDLDEAEATFDRLVGGGGGPKEEDAGFIKLISHPWFEAVAQQVLRAERVRYIELGPTHRPAGAKSNGGDMGDSDDWQNAWQSGAHIDLQVTAADFDATPRRDMLALWFWISDVTPQRAAMRILPGSHRPIQQHWQRILKPERRALLPRVHGLFPKPSTRYPSYPEYIPEPDDFKYTECEPTPVAVPRGTAQIFVRHMHSCPLPLTHQQVILMRHARCYCLHRRSPCCTHRGAILTARRERVSSCRGWLRKFPVVSCRAGAKASARCSRSYAPPSRAFNRGANTSCMSSGE